MARSNRGFTLTEILIAIVILGVLSGTAVINYNKSVELSRWQAAGQILETIYAAQKVFWTVNGETYHAVAEVSPAATDAAPWTPLYLEDPDPAGSRVIYSVDTVAGSGPAATFRAVAKYEGKIRTLDHNRAPGGADNWARP